MPAKRPCLLLIRDGWGIGARTNCNAIFLAKTPNTDKLESAWPSTILQCSGEAVGLPAGFQGNSEVGHLNMGAGRIVFQMLLRINKAIEDRSFFSNPAFAGAMENCLKNKSALHLMGLFQDEGVHSHMSHCTALLKLAKKSGVKKVFLHAFTDGRDSNPRSAMLFISRARKEMKALGLGEFGAVIGRYYAMDRDNRWDRTQAAYEALVNRVGVPVKTVEDAVEDAYESGQSDEFIKPRIVGNFPGIKDNDSVIFFNYRLDRARQLAHAFVAPKFRDFPVKGRPKTFFVCMARYHEDLECPIAFEKIELKNIFGEWVSLRGKAQLRISETEKYAHVTYFFNGQTEAPFSGEDRILVPSPQVATYDLKPEMSLFEVCDRLVQEIKSDKYDYIVCNFVNGDMVGHTGNIPAAVKAVEAIDECTGKVVDAVLKKRGLVFLTADHGNCEDMGGDVVTSHTTNPVKLTVIGWPGVLKKGGTLADIAPTILDLSGLEKPEEMTGQSLAKR